MTVTQVTQNIIKKMSDIELIRIGNKAEKTNWQSGQDLIDQELEERYLDFAEELEQYEEWQELDD